MLKILATLIIVVGAGPAWAQQPAPKAPYIAPVPSNAHWVVTIKPPGSEKQVSSEVAREVVSVDTVKTGATRQVTLTFSDNTTERFDHAGGYILTATPQGPQLIAAVENPPSYPFYSDGFLYSGGVSPESFVGVETFQGVECFHYRTEVNDVWISTETMLPVASKADGTMAYFQFLSAPTVPLALSPEKLALLERQERAYKAFRDLR
jgi:hypothetical protein